jgi:hypothetical protein
MPEIHIWTSNAKPHNFNKLQVSNRYVWIALDTLNCTAKYANLEFFKKKQFDFIVLIKKVPFWNGYFLDSDPVFSDSFFVLSSISCFA